MLKKNVTKIVVVMLAVSFVFSMLVLTGCGGRDKVEKALAGVWNAHGSGTSIEIYEDGTSSSGYTVEHTGKGDDEKRGHYEIVKFTLEILGATSITYYALFDDDSDSLYGIYDGTISTTPQWERSKRN